MGLLSLGVVGPSSAQVNCGESNFTPSRDRGNYLWRDCGTGVWNFRVGAGGSGSLLEFSGSLTADQSFASMQGTFLESSDTFSRPQPNLVRYNMFVAGGGSDGMDFRLQGTTSACLDAGGPVYVGPNRTRVSSPFNVLTLGSCGGGGGGGTGDACSEPSYNLNNETASFLWQDCDTGEWHLRVTAGGRFTQYSGSIEADSNFSSLNWFDLESQDTYRRPSGSRLEYDFQVGNTGQDGIDFSLPSGASACVDAGQDVFVGENRTRVSSPFDLATLGPCDTVAAPEPPPSPTPPPSQPPSQPSRGYAYLWDADETESIRNWGAADLDIPFPRITTGPLKQRGDAALFAKYDVVAGKSFNYDWFAQIQDIDPDTIALREHCPQEYQGWPQRDPCKSGNGIPFNGTGPSTQGCDVYAGHWLYRPGTRLTQNINATATTLRVQDASEFTPGRFLVIYSGGPGAFNNPEHARISGVNRSNNTITLSRRGYKSTARSHPTGAIVAEHVIGNGDHQEPENWAYNLSTACPRDATGRQLNQVMADWLAEHYDLDPENRPARARIDGILFDSDFHFIQDSGHGKRPDVNNDLQLDHGLAGDGRNLWGEGLERFYTLLRNRLPNAILVGGVTESRGFDSLNGTQLEGWPQRNIGSRTPDYREINGRLSTYSINMHHRTTGPAYTEGFNRVATRLYPYNGVHGQDNAPFRFAFGLILLNDGFFGQQNSDTADPWWDEYSVNLGNGRAVANTYGNQAQIRQHSGWMGYPWGPRYRVYDSNTFAPQNNLIPDGSFDNGTAGWNSNGASINIDTSAGNRLEGSGALRIVPSSNTRVDHDATAQTPLINLVAGQQYTIAFATKANEPRTISVAMSDDPEMMTLPAKWTRHVVTFTASRSGGHRLRFNVGREKGTVWLDSVYLFRGNADVYRRDFDNAVVVVNATPSRQTVNLGGTFRRIQGTGQDSINNGASVSSVTINAYDSAILIRP